MLSRLSLRVCVCLLNYQHKSHSHVIMNGVPHSTFREQTLELEQTYSIRNQQVLQYVLGGAKIMCRT
jgi:hypothetical protein